MSYAIANRGFGRRIAIGLGKGGATGVGGGRVLVLKVSDVHTLKGNDLRIHGTK
jgi:hypothetical protein